MVNCSFDQSMDVKELTSLAKQIQLAYTQVADGMQDGYGNHPCFEMRSMDEI